MNKSFIVIILFMILLSALVSATNYYVDKDSIGESCSDNNLGTSLNAPWCTIGKANDALQAGDTVYIRDGNYEEDIAPVNSGSESNPIIYHNYPGESPTLTGSYVGINLYNSYIMVDGINCNGGSQAASAFSQFVLINGNYNVVQNGDFRYISENSQEGHKAVNINGHHNKILNVTIDYVGPENLDTNNEVGDGVWIEDTAHHNLIQGNKIDHSGHGDINVLGYSNIIRQNIFRGQWGRAAGIRNGDNAAGGNVFEDNILWDICKLDFGTVGMDALQMDPGCENSIVRQNLFYNVNGNGIQIYDGYGYYTRNNRIYHNTFYDLGRVQEYHGYVIYSNENQAGHLIDNVFKNNLAYQVYLGDVYYGGTSAAEDWVFTNNHWSSAGDPEFVDEANRDFHLQSDSPAIDAGAFLTTTRSAGSGTQMPVEDAGYFFDGYEIVEGDLIQLKDQTSTARIISVDYDNNILTLDSSLSWYEGQGVALAYSGSAPDIGAFEYDSGSPPPPLPIPGDINNDGSVDLTDLTLVASNFGKNQFDQRADTNSDGTVDIFDVVYVASKIT
jgi:hypothetical protein